MGKHYYQRKKETVIDANYKYKKKLCIDFEINTKLIRLIP